MWNWPKPTSCMCLGWTSLGREPQKNRCAKSPILGHAQRMTLLLILVSFCFINGISQIPRKKNVSSQIRLKKHSHSAIKSYHHLTDITPAFSCLCRCVSSWCSSLCLPISLGVFLILMEGIALPTASLSYKELIVASLDLVELKTRLWSLDCLVLPRHTSWWCLFSRLGP